jgi:hypothetical protein
MKNLLIGGVALLSCVVARASDPVGVYAVVDKVVLEPAESTPERIQIWGTFSLAKQGAMNDQYEAPQKGYLFYKINPDKRGVCEKEWADLKSVAGNGQCVGFGSRHVPTGHIRKSDEKPANPDEYPVAWGLTKVRKSDYPPVKQLLDSATQPSKRSETRAADKPTS